MPVTVIFFRRSATVMEQFRGARPRMRLILAATVVGVPFVFDVTSAAVLTVCRRVEWMTSRTRILGEFLLPSPPHMPDLLSEVKKAKEPLAAALMLHLVTRKLVAWRDHGPFDDAQPDDVLAACLTTPTIAKVRP